MIRIDLVGRVGQVGLVGWMRNALTRPTCLTRLTCLTRPTRPLAAIWLLIAASSTMAHVGSPDTFFVGDAGPYPIRVIVRLPGVIPGRAQVTVRITDEAAARGVQHVTVRAGQWNLGINGAPPPEPAASVPGDASVYAAELWFMTATSYQLFVNVDGAQGHGSVVVPVLALATEQRPMGSSLGLILAALAVFLSVGMLTIVGAAVRESVLKPGVAPDVQRRRRARIAIAATAVFVALMLWGGSRWWTAEAESYRNAILYRPFASRAAVHDERGRRVLTLEIHDNRWSGTPLPLARYNALMPDHGKLMHLFLVREPAPGHNAAFAHLHPVSRTPSALAFDADLPPLPQGRYRVYADIVHESGYAQTLVASADLPKPDPKSDSKSDPDDSWFDGDAALEAATSRFTIADGPTIVWQHGAGPIVERAERVLTFSAQDASGAPLPLEPYMGMLGHVAVTHEDGSVFAHLHPAGSISMAALQKFAGESTADPQRAHAAHVMPGTPPRTDLSIPYAFPKAGRYRIWVQMKHNGRIITAAFDAHVRSLG
jgi:hypothetical protein